LKGSLPQRLAKEKQKLLAAGSPPVQVERTLQELRNKLRAEITVLSRQADAAERKNSGVFDDATARLFRMLRHEATHAWLDRSVFPRDHYEVPRWLHEGLAQVFEAGVIEGGVLRIDAPNADALAVLKAALRNEPLLLADLLCADEGEFLVPHGGGDEEARRHYAYAWGLAHYLTFERRLLHESALEQYVRPAEDHAAADARVRRFEELVGGPLDEFQTHWRSYMARLHRQQPGSALHE
jgi:hypothetical protein